MNNLSRLQSVNAEHEAKNLSDQYGFIPTMQIVEEFATNGWIPAKASEVRTRKAEKVGFQKHMIRFRQENSNLILNDLYPEIVLMNSHDGCSSFQIMAGLFRLICMNGLIVSDSTFAKIRITHKGYANNKVYDAIEHVQETVPMITNNIKDFQQIEMHRDEQEIFAKSALAMKYGEEALENRDFNINSLLYPRRVAEMPPTLWNTFNTVQEKFIKGGDFERKKNKYGYNKTRKARGVGNISEDVRINRGLWMLTEEMAKIKKAA